MFERDESADKIMIYITDDEEGTSIGTQLINSLKLHCAFKIFCKSG